MSVSVEKLVNNDDFLTRLEKAENDEEVLELFKESGMEISIEELKEILTVEADDALDENDLEDVSGGIVGFIVGRAVVRYIRKKGGSSAGGSGGGGFR